MSSLTSLQHGSGSLLEKIPTDRETWENEYKDYAEAEAADFIEFLEGIPDPPREETEDMSAEEKRDLATITTNVEIKPGSFFTASLKAVTLKVILKSFQVKQIELSKHGQQSKIILVIKIQLNYSSYYNTN